MRRRAAGTASHTSTTSPRQGRCCCGMTSTSPSTRRCEWRSSRREPARARPSSRWRAGPRDHAGGAGRRRGGAPGPAGGGPDRRVKRLPTPVPAGGAPGPAALLRALRENGERPVRLVGTDMSELAIGRHLADSFHRVPSGADPGFADAMLEVCRAEHVDAVLPQSSFDLLGLAEAKGRFEGIAVLVSSPEAIRRSNEKAETYALLDRIGVKGPAWRRVAGADAVAGAAPELGYPDRDVCMKPVFSS